MGDELATLDATASAEMVKRGEVSPAELAEGAIERIEKINGDLNAVITPLYEKARAAVEAAIRTATAGSSRSRMRRKPPATLRMHAALDST